MKNFKFSNVSFGCHSRSFLKKSPSYLKCWYLYHLKKLFDSSYAKKVFFTTSMLPFYNISEKHLFREDFWAIYIYFLYLNSAIKTLQQWKQILIRILLAWFPDFSAFLPLQLETWAPKSLSENMSIDPAKTTRALFLAWRPATRTVPFPVIK